MTDYQVLEKRLAERQQELDDRLMRLKKDVSKTHHSDWSEQAQERENDEVLDQLGVEAEQELHAVNHALHRIENGNYGVCERCLGEIPLARLEIKPEVALCVSCADSG